MLTQCGTPTLAGFTQYSGIVFLVLDIFLIQCLVRSFMQNLQSAPLSSIPTSQPCTCQDFFSIGLLAATQLSISGTESLGAISDCWMVCGYYINTLGEVFSRGTLISTRYYSLLPGEFRHMDATLVRIYLYSLLLLILNMFILFALSFSVLQFIWNLTILFVFHSLLIYIL